MSPYEELSSSTINLAAIDRLVAGELPEPERRELLLKLEADPDGWRRCALAFLEDQAWRSALSTPALIPEPVPLPTREVVLKTRWAARLAIAASVLALGFSAGFATRGMGRSPLKVPLAAELPSKTVETPAVFETNQVQEVGWVDLMDSSSGESPPRRIPIVSGSGLDEQWLRDQAPSVPDYVRARWERQGYQVQERRNLVSVLLKDGRRVMIPLDEVALDYVGQQPL